MTLSNPVNGVLSAATSSTVTIVARYVGFTLSQYRVLEYEGLATITVRLNAPSATPVTVAYATSNGTATAGSDYTADAGQ